MSTFTYGYDEQYKCSTCNKFYDSEILEDNFWKCPECGEYIHIAAPRLGDGHTMVRKVASELKIGEFIHLPGIKGIYEIIDINNSKGEKDLCVALKKYGCRFFNNNDFVSVVLGGYFEEHWKNDLIESQE